MNRHLSKPFSPHLSIYKIQITSLFSIFHRFSSIFLITFFLLINILFLFLINLFLLDFIIINDFIYFLFNCLFQVICYFSIFHLLNGLRIILVSFKIIPYSNIIYFKWSLIIFFMIYLIVI
uniref:succinate dehydrogenase subunit 3 n=1 Tax=Palisada intermedia TaxID=397057 RepID=UPI00286BCBE6|nr:succinate dehydrogenase subunit 3 [Palisada intermedia]WMC20777.1 succinate dehydrogenase subunit 3 [Palisada intermedia]